LTRESEVKDAAINGPETADRRLLNILYDANAGYQQTLLSVVTRPAKKTGLRSHRHHQHRRTGGSEPMERHETPDAVRSGAVKPRIQCVRVRAQARAHSRADRAGPGQFPLLRLARVCSASSLAAPASAHASGLASTLAFATASEQAPGQAEHPAAIRQDAPDSKEAWARSGAWPPRAQTGKARYLSALQ